jgi:hypothetical protein
MDYSFDPCREFANLDVNDKTDPGQHFKEG